MMHMNRTLDSALIGIAAITLSSGFGSAAQAINLVQNGSFETYTQNSPYFAGGVEGGYLDLHVTVNGWTNSLNPGENPNGGKSKNVLITPGNGGLLLNIVHLSSAPM
jgi:hypothetical protein